jgi:signal transduction histidine kinase
MTRVLGQLRRLWPTRLAGQLIALLLLALILAQAISFWIFLDERRVAVQSANRLQILSRTASIIRLLEDTPNALHEQILRTASTPLLRFWLAQDSAVDPADAENRDNRLQQVLAGHLAGVGVDEVLVDWRDEDGGWGDWWRSAKPERSLIRPVGDADARARDDDDREREVGRDDDDERRWRGEHRWRHPRLPPNLVVSARLADGQWLNVGTRLPPPSSDWAMPGLVSMGVMAVALSVIVILMVRRMTRPMAQLAAAAERLGRGEAVPPVPERGPADIKETTRAFNRMHGRLQRFVQDRTRMLAAISHDLRTPITSLRLRAEFIEDEEIRTKILETLDDMQRMAEATLAFAREEAAQEDTRLVDLAALVDSVCADLADMGQDVTFAGAPRAPYLGRSSSLKRALRNLIENAVIYGKRARVALESTGDERRIVIDDDGPGIADADFELVFAPFVRLEESRNPETGGVGLGMAISRSIVRGHGGDITLENRPAERGIAGLRVVIRLPQGEGAS